MEKKPKILVVGSYMMDLVASTGRAPKEGETVIGMQFTMAPGGKGNNQAVQCARLGAEVTMVGRIGSDSFGKTLIETAAKSGVDVSRVTVDPDQSTGVAHITLEVTKHDARNRITVCPGANFTLAPDDIAWLKDEVGNYDLVMMQLELPMDVIEAVAAWAYTAGVPVMLNPAPAAPLSDKLLSHVTYLSPNEHEAAEMTGYDMDVSNGLDAKGIEAVAEYFIKKGVKNLIVTFGQKGSVLANEKGINHTACVRADKVVDTTAAGDSFVAAFCTGYMAGLPEKQALSFASHAAAITVSRMGAIPSLPTIGEVTSFIKERNCTGINLEGFDRKAALS